MALRRLLPTLFIGLLVVAAPGALAQDTGPDNGGGLSVAALPGSGFTYQGELRSGGSPVNATCDFQFSLWDAPSSGAQLGGLHTKTNVTVAEGRFTVLLNDAGQFGPSAFSGEARWLRIAVRCPAGGGGYTTLAPRQALTPAPLAFALPGLYTQQNITSTNVIGGHISNTVSAGVFGATIGGGGAAGQPNSVLNNYDTIGGGIGNTANGTRATVGGGEGNSAIGSRSTVGGGQANTASGGRATVGGGYANVASGTGATVGGGGWDGTDVDGNVAAGVASTIGGGFGNVVTTTAEFGTVGGGTSNAVSDQGATVGGGANNAASSDYAALGGGYGNTASGLAATVAGGFFNTASGAGATVGGGGWDGEAADGNVATGMASTIGGGYGNSAGNYYAAVGGGGYNAASGDRSTVGGGYLNTASGHRSTVGGGWGNETTGDSSTVGGGQLNTASGEYATVCGGELNEASADHSVACGGASNLVTGYAASIGGGVGNTASGDYAAIAGGTDNVASGAYSFAAGRNAVAQHPGAFVWAGDSDTPVESTIANQFLVQAAGGVLLAADDSGTTGCALAAGGGTWDCTSDRNAKANFAPVDGVAILNLLAGLPIETWNFNAQDEAIRHIGPMAQDWYAAFGLGEGDTTISAVDADGVALAAIQGLYSVVKEKEAEIAALTERVAALETTVEMAPQAETLATETLRRSVSTGAALPWLLLAGLGLVNVGYVAGRKASPRSR